MKNYIFERLQMAKREIDLRIKIASQMKAKNINYQKIRERVYEKVDIKTMPQKYKDEIMSILDFIYQREISNKFMFPVLFEGKLYSKWKNLPEEARKEMKKGVELERPYPVFEWDFTEGMEFEKHEKD